MRKTLFKTNHLFYLVVIALFCSLSLQAKDKEASKDIKVEIKEKDICIYNFILTEVNIPKISFEITCSKGTYIRSIARDFGDSLKCGAVLSRLRRTKIGDYDVENALRINNLVEIIKEEKIENS